jgi:hypothetical protein
MGATHDSEIPVEQPCKLCGAPAGMTCSEYMAVRQINAAFDRVENAFTTPEELSASDRMDRIGVVS